MHPLSRRPSACEQMGVLLRRAVPIAIACGTAVSALAVLHAVGRAGGFELTQVRWGVAPPAALRAGTPLSPLAVAVRRISLAVVGIRMHGGAESTLPPSSPGWDAPATVGADRWASGVLVSPSGLLVTSAHAVRGATGASALLWGGRRLPATMLGVDPATDIAVLRVPARNLRAARFSTARNVQVGTRVVAIGNPLGLGPSATFGIVSATRRRVYLPAHGRTIEGLLQTDAAANPGSAGGPLCNVRGDVVGVLVAEDPDGQGIAFAVPAATVRHVAMRISKRGTVPRPWLGVRYRQVAVSSGRHASREQCLVVHGVAPKSPAKAAGLRPGDVLVSANGRPIRSREDLRAALAKAGVGGEVVLTVLRGENAIRVRMVARQMPG